MLYDDNIAANTFTAIMKGDGIADDTFTAMF